MIREIAVHVAIQFNDFATHCAKQIHANFSADAVPGTYRLEARQQGRSAQTRVRIEPQTQHEVELTAYAMRSLTEAHGDKITIHGPSEPAERGGVLSFVFGKDSTGEVHPHDVAQVLDQVGICVRAGHHCAKPLMTVLGANATSRASLYVYNDESDIDQLVAALHSADDLFSF